MSGILVAKMARHEAHHAAAALMVGRRVTRVYLISSDDVGYHHGQTLSERTNDDVDGALVVVWAAVLLEDGLGRDDMRKLVALGEMGADLRGSRDRALEMSRDPKFRRLASKFDNALWHKPDLDEAAVQAVIDST